jgi:hypothetical protein
LSEAQMRDLRSVSTRFTNHYEWGDFKGNPAQWMERYFDAFVYFPNWGIHEFMLRQPRHVFDLNLARQYCCGNAASSRAKGEFVILTFLSQDEEGGGEWDDGTGWLSALTPLRAELAGGDHRALYLAWLLCVQCGELEDGATEPPVPQGLNNLNASLTSFADFLRIDPDLIAAAAETSADIGERFHPAALASWIAALPQEEKDDWLLRLALGEERHLHAELLGRFRVAHHKAEQPAAAPRTVAQLREAAAAKTRERNRKRAEKAAAERARQEREAAALRDARLKLLAKHESQAWEDLGRLVARKIAKDYDTAINLLKELGELAELRGERTGFAKRVAALKSEHSRKFAFIARLEKAGLGC